MAEVKDSCPHIKDIREPKAGDEVHKEECTQCFDTDLNEGGLNVCLTCFNGGCTGEKKHFTRHHAVSKHPVVVNILRTEIPEDPSQEPKKITKLAIGVEGGADAMMGPKYAYTTKVHCLVCNVQLNSKTPEVDRVVDRVLKFDAASKQKEGFWEEKRTACDHTKKLVQAPDAPKIQTKALAHCTACPLNENLWLCMTCGYLGCPRPIHASMGGGGGNGHAAAHYQKTKHPLVLKLGTITPEGSADINCYECDEMKIDPDLAKHLAHLGIKMEEQEKTGKTMAEMDLEINLNRDWSSDFEAGEKLEIVFGPGKCGLNNMGNSCYLSSVVQVLFSLPAFQRRYYGEGLKHLQECKNARPATCYHCQFAKVGEALMSGRYSPAPSPEQLELHLKLAEKANKKDSEGASVWEAFDFLFHNPMKDGKDGKDGKDKADAGAAAEPEKKAGKKKDLQPGVTPRMFKELVTKDSKVFGNNKKQQDALEFLQFLLDKVQRAEKASNVDPTDCFRFQLEERIECSKCKKVRYQNVKASSISVEIPPEAAAEPEPAKPAAAAPAAPAAAPADDGPKPMDVSDDAAKPAAKEDKSKPPAAVEGKPVSLDACLSRFAQPSFIERWNCPHCKVPTTAKKTTRFKTFPDVLVTHVQRFVFDAWVPRKLNTRVEVPAQFELDSLRGSGLQPSEEELPGSGGGAAAAPVPNEELLAQLVSMGFNKNRCARALLATGNNNLDLAMNHVFGNMEDPSLDLPLEAPKSSGSKPKDDDIPSEALAALTSMGFPDDRCRYALKQTSNNPERAMEWLLSHMDDEIPADAPAAAGAPSDAKEPKVEDKAPAQYRFAAVVTHLGKSTAYGHYVAHVLKEGKWIYFNDAKVSLSTQDRMLQSGYIYFFRRAGK